MSVHVYTISVGCYCALLFACGAVIGCSDASSAAARTGVGGSDAGGDSMGGSGGVGDSMGGSGGVGGSMGGAGGDAGGAGAPVQDGTYPNAAGASATISSAGPIDKTNEFFHSFGNGRACVSCHRPEDGFSITPKNMQVLFEKCGLDSDDPAPPMSEEEMAACAIFRTNDGANSPTADVSTASARREAYSLLLSRGLIRVSLPLPDAAKREFEIVEVNDPYGFGSPTMVSVYRRPLPATNLSFASGVMWDFRETPGSAKAPWTPDVTMAPPLRDQLVRQAINATLGHAEAMSPGLTEAQAESIVNFELSLYSAQTTLTGVGDLASEGAKGGVQALLNQPVTPICGNLDVFDNNPMYPQCQQYVFDPKSFTIFDAWINIQGADARSALQASIARGQVLFTTHKTQSPPGFFFNHSGDDKNLTCSTCHASFNTGSSTVPVGFTNVAVGRGLPSLNSPTPQNDFVDPTLPTYKLRCNANGMASFTRTMGTLGCRDGSEPGVPPDEVVMNDPGRAMKAGAWQTIGSFKCPTLRNLSARAPYFHDGSAETLDEVVEHYKKALGFEFTDAEKRDLVNFLSAL